MRRNKEFNNFSFKLLLYILSFLIVVCCDKKNKDINTLPSWLGIIAQKCRSYKVKIQDVYIDKLRIFLDTKELNKCFGEPKRIYESTLPCGVNKRQIVRRWVYDGFTYDIVEFKSNKSFAYLSFLDLRRVPVNIYYKKIEITSRPLQDYLLWLVEEFVTKKNVLCIWLFSYDYIYYLNEPLSYGMSFKANIKESLWIDYSLIFEGENLTIIEGGINCN